MFGLSYLQILLISFVFLIAINTIISNACSSYSINTLRKQRSLVVAISKLKLFDQYILSKLSLISAFILYILTYNFLNNMFDSIYLALIALIISFILTIILTFVSKLSYLYTANVLLDTKLNEKTYFLDNLKKLSLFYFPIFIISLFLPSLLSMNIELYLKLIISLIFIIAFIFLYLASMPTLMILTHDARPVDSDKMNYKFDSIFSLNGIKKYSFYLWDDNRGKDNNSSIKGINQFYMFISNDLAKEASIEEIEGLVLIELEKFKSHHSKKIALTNAFMIFSIAFIFGFIYFFKFDYWYINLIMILLVVTFFISVTYSISIQRMFETESDMYARRNMDKDTYISFSNKIRNYKDTESEVKAIEELFKKYPDLVKKYREVNEEEEGR